MITNNLGYNFECRLDCNKKVGFIQSFKVINSKGVQVSNIACAVDSYGKIVIPAYNNLSLGFRPLTEICETEEALHKYIRSNKSAFGLLGSFSMIANVTLRFDLSNGQLLDDSIIDFFVPKTVVSSMQGFKEGVPVLICEKVTSSGGLNTIKVTATMHNAYISAFKSCVNMQNTSGREEFIAGVINR